MLRRLIQERGSGLPRGIWKTLNNGYLTSRWGKAGKWSHGASMFVLSRWPNRTCVPAALAARQPSTAARRIRAAPEAQVSRCGRRFDTSGSNLLAYSGRSAALNADDGVASVPGAEWAAMERVERAPFRRTGGPEFVPSTFRERFENAEESRKPLRPSMQVSLPASRCLPGRHS